MPYTTLLASLLGHLSLMCECEWRFVHTIQNVKLFLSFRFVEWPDSDPTSAPAATARPDAVSTSSLSLHGSSVYDVNTNTLLRCLRGTKTSHVVGPLDIITHARSSNSGYRVTARKKKFFRRVICSVTVVPTIDIPPGGRKGGREGPKKLRSPQILPTHFRLCSELVAGTGSHNER